MTKNYFETFVGFAVIFTAVYFAFFALNKSGIEYSALYSYYRPYTFNWRFTR